MKEIKKINERNYAKHTKNFPENKSRWEFIWGFDGCNEDNICFNSKIVDCNEISTINSCPFGFMIMILTVSICNKTMKRFLLE